MDVVAVVSIVSSAVVGIAAVAVPAWVRREDRRAERETFIRERRAVAYGAAIRLLREGLQLDYGERASRTAEVEELIWLWGSEEVRRLFGEWLRVLPDVFGPDVTREDRAREMMAANAARGRMGDEVQGRVQIV